MPPQPYFVTNSKTEVTVWRTVWTSGFKGVCEVQELLTGQVCKTAASTSVCIGSCACNEVHFRCHLQVKWSLTGLGSNHRAPGGHSDSYIVINIHIIQVLRQNTTAKCIIYISDEACNTYWAAVNNHEDIKRICYYIIYCLNEENLSCSLY